MLWYMYVKGETQINYLTWLNLTIFDFIIYTDDTNLSSSLKILIKDSKRKIRIEKVINNELEKISSWLKTNKLSSNVKKTKYMIFHTVQRKVNTLHLKINNTIERVTQFDFLGLTLKLYYPERF